MLEWLRRFYDWFVGNPLGEWEKPEHPPKGKWILVDGCLDFIPWWNVSPIFECIGGDTPEDPIVLGENA
jgi:hypothetical protein